MEEGFNVAEIYGEDVFSDNVMRSRLPKNVYKELHKATLLVNHQHLYYHTAILEYNLYYLQQPS